MTNQSAQSPKTVLTVDVTQDAYVRQLDEPHHEEVPVAVPLPGLGSRTTERAHHRYHRQLLSGRRWFPPPRAATLLLRRRGLDLAMAYRNRFAWLAELDTAQIQQLIAR